MGRRIGNIGMDHRSLKQEKKQEGEVGRGGFRLPWDRLWSSLLILTFKKGLRYLSEPCSHDSYTLWVGGLKEGRDLWGACSDVPCSGLGLHVP